MFRTFNGYNTLGHFGKYRRHAAPSPAAPDDSGKLKHEQELLRMKQQHEKEMMQMKMEMAKLQQGGATPAQAAKVVAAKHPDAPKPTAADAVKAHKEIARKIKEEKEGGVVEGSGGKTRKELLAPGIHQTRFMRSTDKVGANLHRDDYRKMGKAPPGWSEEKYLAKHADVAKAVAVKAMPSGLWHYLKYGKAEGRALAGYRRPGFLAGIFANWDQADW